MVFGPRTRATDNCLHTIIMVTLPKKTAKTLTSMVRSGTNRMQIFITIYYYTHIVMCARVYVMDNAYACAQAEECLLLV